MDYVLQGDIFFCNQKPFGKFGPTLDEILTMPSKPETDINENEIYLFIPDIKTNGESKIEMYFANLFGVKNIKMLFIEKKAAIALRSVPLSSNTKKDSCFLVSQKLNLKTSLY